jgi:hypothetical protein
MWDWMWELSLCGILSVPQNIVMNLNNVMDSWSHNNTIKHRHSIATTTGVDKLLTFSQNGYYIVDDPIIVHFYLLWPYLIWKLKFLLQNNLPKKSWKSNLLLFLLSIFLCECFDLKLPKLRMGMYFIVIILHAVVCIVVPYIAHSWCTSGCYIAHLLHLKITSKYVDLGRT